MVKKQIGVVDARLVTYHRPMAYKNNIYSQANIQLFNIGDSGFMEYFLVSFMYLWNP
jgi:hypothetical protein